MNYYKRHLGDYARDTGWLTTYQHGVYALLLDWYYSNEKPVPVDLAYRIVKARSGPERRAVDEVVSAFFDVSKGDGFAYNKRADLDISKYKTKSRTNSLIAQVREGTKRAQSVAGLVVGSRNSGEPSHKPLATSQERASSLSSTDDCPHELIIAMYHEALPANPRIKAWTGARQANLRARWREDAKRQSPDYWRRFLAHVASSPFLTGQRCGPDGRPFLPGLDWLVKPENFAKVIEGRYHDKAASA